MDILFRPLEKEKMPQMPPLTLAHIGDCIFELMARSYVVHSGVFTAGKAHKKTVSLVSARAQSRMAHAVFESLSDEEKDIYKRGRNAKPKTMSKNADTAEQIVSSVVRNPAGWRVFSKCV